MGSDMTRAEKDAQLGQLLREYRDADKDVRCHVVWIRKAARVLTAIESEISNPSKPGLAEKIGAQDLASLESLRERIEETRRALEHRDQSRGDLADLDYYVELKKADR